MQKLIERGIVTQTGLDAVASAKADGTWDAPGAAAPSADQNDELDSLIQGHEPAYTNWGRMSPSVRRTYGKLYFDAKSDATRARRLERIIDRLDQNLKPM